MTAEDDMTEESSLPYRRLCQAIIIQAIRDANGVASDTLRSDEAELYQRRAHAWLSSPNPDFHEVCEGAGLNPHHVRKHALEFIESGKPMPKFKAPVGRTTDRRKALSFGSIAARAGVSTSATSRALREGFGSFELKQRVNKAKAEIQRELHA